MARLASIANAGYEPVPVGMVPSMATLVEVEPEGDYAVIDPCAGEGAAIIGMTKTWFNAERRKSDVTLYAVEMELDRATKLKAAEHSSEMRYGRFRVLHGDAFAVQWDHANVSIAYINSPFDWDKSEARRMEEKFLRRFLQTIYIGGVLMYVLPYNALRFSADTIAKNFTNVQCVRFPDWDFGLTSEGKFNRVVLLGERIHPLLDPDPRIVAKIIQWDADWQPIQDTWSAPLVKARAFASKTESVGFDGWKIVPIDIAGMLQRARPWHSSDRGMKLQPIVGVVPDKPAHDGLDRKFPVSLPLKPAYLASGIAAGVFNGELICPDDPESPLPKILVKGVFEKDLVHVPSEDKRNKEGEKTQETYVQQPKLVITILDLRTKKYSELVSSVDTTGEMDPAKMSVGDLLQHYGKSMMASMLKSCPVMHDPTKDDAIEIPGIARPLYTAQAHAVTAALKVMGGLDKHITKRKGQTCFVIGEVGCGKTSMSIAASSVLGARRTLVMCPPIVVPVWEEEVKVLFPDYRVVVLDDVHDVHELAESTDPRPVFAIFSSTTAKLSHSWEGVSSRAATVNGVEYTVPARCPKCNSIVNASPETLAAKRQTCTVRHRNPAVDSEGNENYAAYLARKLAEIMVKAAPNSMHVEQSIKSPMLKRARVKWEAQTEEQRDAAWDAIIEGAGLKAFITELFQFVSTSKSRDHVQKFGQALLLLLVSFGKENTFMQAARAMYKASADDTQTYGPGDCKRDLALQILSCCEKESRDAVAQELRTSITTENFRENGEIVTTWNGFVSSMEEFDTEKLVTWACYKPRNADGWGDHAWGDVGGAVAAIEILSSLALWGESDPCGSPLYQAVPKPRKVALAPYIAKRFPNLFDCMIFDEFHTLSNNIDSAQSAAMMRLAQLGKPVFALTGSFMNGYAESMFAGMWALDPEFRKEFERNQGGKFVQRYGYIKIKVEMKDKDKKTVSFGANSDRVERVEREAGNAPGVLPLFVLQYLLRRAVVIHKEDLKINLPPCTHIVKLVDAGKELQDRHDSIKRHLREQIKKDAFGPNAGKLFGQVGQFVTYPDRSTRDTGNDVDGWWRIRYPEDCDGGLLLEQEPFDSQIILAKEQMMLDTIREELAEDRNVLVFGYNAEVLPRLRRLIQEQLGEPCAMLLASEDESTKEEKKARRKLGPGEGTVAKKIPNQRSAWVRDEVSAKGIRVMVVNSTAVQVGINSLVGFNSIWWHQDPACNPIGFRQANGRIDRPGQKKPTRIFFPIYRDTAQAAAHSLLLLKVGVSEGTDGLDARGAMAAAGVGEQATVSAFGVGKQLYAMMDREAPRVIRPQLSAQEKSSFSVSMPAPIVVPNVPTLRTPRKPAQDPQIKLF